MKTLRLYSYAAIAIILTGCAPSTQQNNQALKDPLNQWTEGPAKASILSFVKSSTDEANPDFIGPKDRVAVFDMDGTILLEKPNPVNFDVVIRILVEQIAAKTDGRKSV